jgi:hypothetical protein
MLEGDHTARRGSTIASRLGPKAGVRLPNRERRASGDENDQEYRDETIGHRVTGHVDVLRE